MDEIAAGNMGARIKSLRKSRKMTQTDFGKVFGIVKSTVSSYETGKSIPDDGIKISICKYFNVSMDFLVGLVPNPKKEEPDEEIKGFIDEINRRPELKKLLLLLKGANKKDIMRATAIIEAIRKVDSQKWENP